MDTTTVPTFPIPHSVVKCHQYTLGQVMLPFPSFCGRNDFSRPYERARIAELLIFNATTRRIEVVWRSDVATLDTWESRKFAESVLNASYAGQTVHYWTLPA